MSVAREPRKKKIIETGLRDLEPSIREYSEKLLEHVKEKVEKEYPSKKEKR
ncbi:MAG: hypothetical protein ACPLSM_00780 [Thermosphaera sp.]